MTRLDPRRNSDTMKTFEAGLRERLIGQDRAVRGVVDTFRIFQAGIFEPDRTLANLLMLGPTGCGKTRLAEAIAEVLFGNPKAMIKVDCSEFHEYHEVAKLIGSPPGYIGHQSTTPIFTQETINRHQTENLKLTLVLFDEIEKASMEFWQLLLGILDKATLTLGNNERVDFSRCVIFLTSNLGSREIDQLMKGGGLGFKPEQPVTAAADLDQKVYRVAIEAARRKFSPEFMNRIDKTVVFRVLQSNHLEQILEIELAMAHKNIAQSIPDKQFQLRFTPATRRFLLAEGCDQRYGARHLKRAIRRPVVVPLSSLLETNQIGDGDTVLVEYQKAERDLVFHRERELSMNAAATPRRG